MCILAKRGIVYIYIYIYVCVECLGFLSQLDRGSNYIFVRWSEFNGHREWKCYFQILFSCFVSKEHGKKFKKLIRVR